MELTEKWERLVSYLESKDRQVLAELKAMARSEPDKVRDVAPKLIVMSDILAEVERLKTGEYSLPVVPPSTRR